jgi:hypothetical protein
VVRGEVGGKPGPTTDTDTEEQRSR